MNPIPASDTERLNAILGTMERQTELLEALLGALDDLVTALEEASDRPPERVRTGPGHTHRHLYVIDGEPDRPRR